MRSFRQSKVSSKNLTTKGSLADNKLTPLVISTVHANSEFFTQGRALSDSRFWACMYIDMNRLKQPLSCSWLASSDFVAFSAEMLLINRFRIGSDVGTTTVWQLGVPRTVAKMWIIQACRSVLMIDGKTSAASTRAFNEKIGRAHV